MFDLPNGCGYTKPYVNPIDWDQPNAFLDTEWYIEYWFFDPTFKETFPRGKRCRFKKGFKDAKTLTERRKVVKEALRKIKEKLENGYNPITKQTLKQEESYNLRPQYPEESALRPTNENNKISTSQDLLNVAQKVAVETEKAQQIAEEKKDDTFVIHILTPDLPFIEALWKAYRKLKGVPAHLGDVRGAIRAMNRAAFLLNYLSIPISEITPQHIMLSFELLAKINPKFTDKTRNKLRSYLVSLFRELAIARAVSSNFIKELPILPEDKPLRRVLEEEEIIKLDRYLKERDYNYWRFIHLFHQSGCRETEFSKVRVGNVNLNKREFSVWVLKGRVYREVIKPIALPVLHLWREVISECHMFANEIKVSSIVDEIYLFSKFIKPGFFSIRPDQFGRRWKKYVKDDLGIDKDLYKLKHLYSDRIAAALSLQHAQDQNSHEFAATTLIYTVNEEERRREELKNIAIPLSQRSILATAPTITQPLRSAKRLNKFALTTLNKKSLSVLATFLYYMQNNTYIYIPSPDSFPLSITKVSEEIKTILGTGCRYLVSQGLHKESNWLSVCEIEIFVIKENKNGPKEKVIVYTCSLKHYPFSNEQAIQFEGDKVSVILKGTSAHITPFVDGWMLKLEEEFLLKNNSLLPESVINDHRKRTTVSIIN